MDRLKLSTREPVIPRDLSGIYAVSHACCTATELLIARQLPLPPTPEEEFEEVLQQVNRTLRRRSLSPRRSNK